MSAIDNIVDQNNALWELLTSSDSKSPEEKLALLKRAFPGAKSLEDMEYQLGDPEFSDGPEFDGWSERSVPSHVSEPKE